jgi:hypothetical protein
MASPYIFDRIFAEIPQTVNMDFQNFYIPLPPYLPIMITHVSVSCDQTDSGNGLLYYLGSTDSSGSSAFRFFCSRAIEPLVSGVPYIPVTENYPIWVTQPYLIVRTSAAAGATITVNISTRVFENNAYLKTVALQNAYNFFPSGSVAGTFTLLNSGIQRLHIKSIYLVGDALGGDIITALTTTGIGYPTFLSKSPATILKNSVLESPFNIGTDVDNDDIRVEFAINLTGDLHTYITYSVVS